MFFSIPQEKPMAKANQLRITRTTALFVTSLGRILREHLKLDVCDHECWTFTMQHEREQCGSPNDCPWHGPAYFGRKFGLMCYPYHIRTYFGVGNVNVRVRGKFQLRAVIEHTTCDAMGQLYEVRLWARDKDGETLKGVYGILDDGTPYVDKGCIKEEPPRKIAFWAAFEDLPEEVVVEA